MPSDTPVRVPLRARDGSIRAHALVDREDYEGIAPWRWSLNSDGRPCRATRRNGQQVKIYLYRQIMGFPRGDIDHRNGDPLDCRRRNLRVCTHAENMQNRRGGYGTSSHRGVYWSEARGKWIAQVTLSGVARNLGGYVSETEAAAVAAAFRATHMPFSAEAA